MLSIFFSLLLLFQEVTSGNSVRPRLYQPPPPPSSSLTPVHLASDYDNCVSFCQADLDSDNLTNETECSYIVIPEDRGARRVFLKCV